MIHYAIPTRAAVELLRSDPDVLAAVNDRITETPRSGMPLPAIVVRHLSGGARQHLQQQDPVSVPTLQIDVVGGFLTDQDGVDLPGQRPDWAALDTVVALVQDRLLSAQHVVVTAAGRQVRVLAVQVTGFQRFVSPDTLRPRCVLVARLDLVVEG